MTSHQQLLARTACSQFRLMVSGSAALPTSLFTKWAGISGHELLERYGMTEIGMALGNVKRDRCSVSRGFYFTQLYFHIQPIEGPRIPGHVGIPFPGVSVKIVNEQGVDITASTVDVSSSTNGEGSALIGELLVRGNQVSPGYFNRPAATQEAWTEPDQDPSGLKWFKTGDIATRIAYSGGGYSYKILGRASVDIIKSSGFKVSALDVEREILNHPRVAEVAVLGVPDDVYGERIGALIVLKEGDKAVVALAQDDTNHPHHPLFPPFTLSELQEWLSPRLAKYKSPSLLLIIDSLPKNALGKVNKVNNEERFHKYI